MSESISGTLDLIIGLVVAYGLNVVAAIVTLIVGWIAAGWCAGAMRRLMAKTDKVDAMLGGFFASFVRYGILALRSSPFSAGLAFRPPASLRCSVPSAPP